MQSSSNTTTTLIHQLVDNSSSSSSSKSTEITQKICNLLLLSSSKTGGDADEIKDKLATAKVRDALVNILIMLPKSDDDAEKIKACIYSVSTILAILSAHVMMQQQKSSSSSSSSSPSTTTLLFQTSEVRDALLFILNNRAKDENSLYSIFSVINNLTNNAEGKKLFATEKTRDAIADCLKARRINSSKSFLYAASTIRNICQNPSGNKIFAATSDIRDGLLSCLELVQKNVECFDIVCLCLLVLLKNTSSTNMKRYSSPEFLQELRRVANKVFAVQEEDGSDTNNTKQITDDENESRTTSAASSESSSASVLAAKKSYQTVIAKLEWAMKRKSQDMKMLASLFTFCLIMGATVYILFFMEGSEKLEFSLDFF